MKRHNGGVGVITCKVLNEINHYFYQRDISSGSYLSRRYDLSDEEEIDEEMEIYYTDPLTNTTNITDLIDPWNLNYTMLQYATVVTNNSFVRNYAGMKGTALLIRELNEL